MPFSKQDSMTKIHLIIAVVIVIPAALIYGFFPETFLELSPNTTDEYNFYKAISGLYLGFSVLWVLGIFKQPFLKAALISNVIFMLGLAFGRIISILVDGLPSNAYTLGIVGELILGCYGLWALKHMSSRHNTKKH